MSLLDVARKGNGMKRIFYKVEQGTNENRSRSRASQKADSGLNSDKSWVELPCQQSIGDLIPHLMVLPVGVSHTWQYVYSR